MERDETRRGLVILYTGDGKGKTSAALGMLLRARGWEMRVVMRQFVKSRGLRAGEHRAALRLDVAIRAEGAGFTNRSEDRTADVAAARECWEACRAALADPTCDVLICDEITYPLRYGWLPVGEVLAALRDRPAHQHVVLTGRDALPELIDVADLVTEMRMCKHPHSLGVAAQKGVEF
jgi:cob(I)alamin adenosyltransferase